MKNRSIKEQRLDALENDFRPLLLACLGECADGRYGLFGQNDGPELARYYQWDDAECLKEMALEIRAFRAEFGQATKVYSGRGADIVMQSSGIVDWHLSE